MEDMASPEMNATLEEVEFDRVLPPSLPTDRKEIARGDG